MASYALNAPPTVPLTYIALFGTGALIMRGAGCTINDLWDRNLDNAVGTPLRKPYTRVLLTHQTNIERTKTRPLARGDITPGQAIAFLAPQLTAGLAVLTQLNWYRYVRTFCSPNPIARNSPSPTSSPMPASSWEPPPCPW